MLFSVDPMPRGIRYLYVINVLVVFIYAVLLSSLTIFLTKMLGFSNHQAESAVGLFLALNFILHLLAGFIGGRYMSNRALLLLSTLIKLIGIYILSTEDSSNVFFGLTLVVIGCGVNTTCLQCILTQRFEQDDSRREIAFFWMYSALNAGFLLGFTMSGYFDLKGHYSHLYILGFAVTVLAVLCMYIAWPHMKDKDSFLSSATDNQRRWSYVVGTAIVLILIPFLVYAFKYPSLANDLIFAFGFISLVCVLYFLIKCKKKESRDGLLAFLILTCFSIVFWSLFYVGPMGGVLFLKNNVDLSLWGHNLAPQWLMNINSVFVIVGSPFLAYCIRALRNKGLNVSIPRQFFISLLLIALSYFVFSIGIYNGNDLGKTSIYWVVLHYALQAGGELFIAPVGYAMIGKLAPPKLQTFMMGIWMMVSGIAVEFSNIFSHYMTKSESTDPLLSNSDYAYVFNNLGLYTILSALVLLLFVPFLERLVLSVTSTHSCEE